MSATECFRFQEDVVGLLEGTANDDLRSHVASCDSCRDASHDLERVSATIARAGDDYTLQPPLAERLAKLADEASEETAQRDAERERISETRMKTEPPGPAPAPLAARPPRSRKALWLIVAGCVSVAASMGVGLKLADRERTPAAVASRAWHGRVAKIARSGADKTGGLFVDSPSGKIALAEASEVKTGMKISTDGRTRARLELDDGSVMILDRASEIEIEPGPGPPA